MRSGYDRGPVGAAVARSLDMGKVTGSIPVLGTSFIPNPAFAGFPAERVEDKRYARQSERVYSGAKLPELCEGKIHGNFSEKQSESPLEPAPGTDGLLNLRNIYIWPKKTKTRSST